MEQEEIFQLYKRVQNKEREAERQLIAEHTERRYRTFRRSSRCVLFV